jgi:hypothetical protein
MLCSGVAACHRYGTVRVCVLFAVLSATAHNSANSLIKSAFVGV